MAKPGVEEFLDNLRAKYPALASSSVRWQHLVDMAKAGKRAEAEDMARSYLRGAPHLAIRNKIAVRHRLERREFLKAQRDLEQQVRQVFQKMYEKIDKMLARNADDDGKIPLHKTNKILDRIREFNKEAWAEFNVLLSQGVRSSVRFGLTVTMDSAQDGLELHKKEFSHEADLKGIALDDMIQVIEQTKKAVIARTSAVFKTIYDRVKKRRLMTGLFKARTKAGFQWGHKLSRAVWDLRNQNEIRLRRIVSTGIAQGKAATSLSSKVKGMTTVGAGVEPAGAGVYRSAYKNALRMVRTETNNAYHEAEIEYAARKGYKKMWNVTGSACADCLQYAGKIYDPEDIPPLIHPNCSCFMTTVIPGVS